MDEKRKKPRSPTFGKIDRKVLETAHSRGATLGVVAGLFTVSLILLARAFFFQTFKIPSSSMAPTLLAGDHIIVNKIVYGISTLVSGRRRWQMQLPARGDVVVFARFSEFEDRDAETHYIKRIVGVPGDIVEVKGYRTFVNGMPVGRADQVFVGPEIQVEVESGGNYGPVTLNDGNYFVLGDNQANSRDSRFYGPISLDDIEGRAELIYWSWELSLGGAAVRWRRVGDVIR